ncbi:hypothetical protein, partial [Oleiphilus sp. HI0086]
ISILVSTDTVYKVDHETNELKAINHFKNEICEIHPKELVVSSLSDSGTGTVETFSVRHAESVYVVTAVDEEDGSACENMDASRTYYELPLNYQFDASFTDPSLTDELLIVDEAQAKAKLVFGWIDNPDNAGEYILNYGYLGYSFALRKLEFFDQDRNSVWSQTRELASYPSIDANGFTSPFYLFDVRTLDNYQYLVQMNQDIFVVDASTEFFAKTQSDVGTILTDRIINIGSYAPYIAGGVEPGIYEVEAYHDDDDLVIIDEGKIFTYPFLQNQFTPDSVSHDYLVETNDGFIYQEQAHRRKKTFSQFDYQRCDEEDDACNAAHDVTASSWQFITDCDADLGCQLEQDVADLCETQEEHDVSQSGRNICSAEFFEHLGELNNTENDAQFVGYMQYLADSLNKYEVSIFEDSLLLSASMLEKDLIVRYFYKQSLSAPKSVREHVMFGAESDLYALEHFVENNNVYISALIPGAVRSNECYKNYLRVECDLGSQEGGGSDRCTGADLAEGTCFSSFTEFESTALFCTPNQVLTRVCADASLDSGSIRTEASDEDGKWVRMLDLSGDEADRQTVYLLTSSHQEALDEQVLDEGRLLTPTLYEIDDNDGSLGSELGVLNDVVETVIGGVLYQKASGAEPLFEGLLDVLSYDVSVSEEEGASGQELLSRHSKYAIVNTLSDDNSAVSVRQTPRLAETVFKRFDTAPKSTGSSE